MIVLNVSGDEKSALSGNSVVQPVTGADRLELPTTGFMHARTTVMHEAEQESIIFWKGAIMITRTSVKGGRLAANHSQVLKVRTGLKGGRLAVNHSERLSVRRR
jgi:hypothetical protein